MAYDNKNSGAFFKNEKKETDKHPDYRGTINADGTDYWASVWVSTSKKGQKYFSVKLTKKDARSEEVPPKQVDEYTDDGEIIPF